MYSISQSTEEVSSAIQERKYNPSEMPELFAYIYENEIWGNDNSPDYPGSSGPGSYLEYNEEYITFVKQFIADRAIGIVNDFGCGTFISGPSIYGDNNVIYNGYDIYKPLIDLNSANCPRYNMNFSVFDFYNNMNKIPFSDLVIIKDVFSHWSNECINNLLTHLIERHLCKYILITNCCHQDTDNRDINLGSFRPLNSQMSPLKDYGAVSVLKYRTKEVSLIDLSSFFQF
jgi:hypothetical protein